MGSQIFDNENYICKVYPDYTHNNRNRLKSEIKAYDFFSINKKELSNFIEGFNLRSLIVVIILEVIIICEILTRFKYTL